MANSTVVHPLSKPHGAKRRTCVAHAYPSTLINNYSRLMVWCNKKAVQSQGEPRDAAVNFHTYRILQWHRAISLLRHGFLVHLCLQTADNASLLSFRRSSTEIAKKMSSTNPLSFDALSLRNPRGYSHTPYTPCPKKEATTIPGITLTNLNTVS